MDFSLIVANIYEQCINASLGEKTTIKKTIPLNSTIEKSLNKLGCKIIFKNDNTLVIIKVREYVALFEPNSEIEQIIETGSIDKEKLHQILKIVKKFPIRSSIAKKIKKYLEKISAKNKELYQLKESIEQNIKIKKENLA